MIRIQALEYRYPTGDFQLSVPELIIGSGEKVAVIGPSGSGKTTLLNLISGILIPDSGRVFLDDTPINELDDTERRNLRITRIGFVFQDFELMDYLNIFDNILHPFRITAALKLDRQVRNQACDLAEQMGIGNKLNRRPDDLSQGEKQRAAICRALLTEPDLVLADEATGNLDPENKTRILDLLFETISTLDATLLAVTHDHELLTRFDRTVDFKDFHRRRQP
jgi:putative ABC transport system ATP-binding protein